MLCYIHKLDANEPEKSPITELPKNEENEENADKEDEDTSDGGSFPDEGLLPARSLLSLIGLFNSGHFRFSNQCYPNMTRMASFLLIR